MEPSDYFKIGELARKMYLDHCGIDPKSASPEVFDDYEWLYFWHDAEKAIMEARTYPK